MSLPIPHEDMRRWHAELVRIERDAGGEMFMGLPDRWYEPTTYGCRGGHVSHAYLKSEESGNVCLECGEGVWLICPEFKKDEQLKVALDLFVTTIGNPNLSSGAGGAV